MREKEKMLVTSIFSFSHIVLKELLPQSHQNLLLCGTGLKSFTLKHVCGDTYSLICNNTILNSSSLRKEMLVNSIFSFFHNVFKSIIFKAFQNLRLFGKGLTLYQVVPCLYRQDIQNILSWLVSWPLCLLPAVG